MQRLTRFLTWGCLMCLAPIASAQDFRVDTEVFSGDKKEPVIETLTIFAGGRVYDFQLGVSEEIAIFEPARSQFTLLDPQRKLRCTVANQELLQYVQDLNKAAIDQKLPLFAAAADPQFEVRVEKIADNPATRMRITLSSKLITYAATGKAPTQALSVDAFKQFADWYSRLNAIRGGNLPPGARLALNRELAERGLLPDEIVRTTVQPGIRDKKLTVRSRHLFNWSLSGADRKRIEQSGDFLANFQAVSFEEFRSLPAQPGAEKTTKR